MDETQRSQGMPDEFDRLRGSLDGVSMKTKPHTIIVAGLLGVGGEQTFIVETFRQRDDLGDGRSGRARDTVFLRTIGPSGGHRYILPAPVADAIAGQRNALDTRDRRAAAKRAAATRKARQK